MPRFVGLTTVTESTLVIGVSYGFAVLHISAIERAGMHGVAEVCRRLAKLPPEED
jgi:hypothetical protein